MLVSILAFITAASANAQQTQVALEELDIFASPKWYFITSPKNNSDEPDFRAYAGMYHIKSGRMMGGAANLLTFHCRSSGHYYSMGLPDNVEIKPLAAVSNGDGIRLDFRMQKETVTLQSRKWGDDQIYFDTAGNQTVFDKIGIDLLSNSLLVIDARGQQVSTKIISDPIYKQKVDTLLRESGYSFEKYSEFERDKRCLESLGARMSVGSTKVQSTIRNGTDLPATDCSAMMFRANALFIRATTFCTKSFMDSKAGYIALEGSRRCAGISNVETKIKNTMLELEDFVKRRGKAAACKWLEQIAAEVVSEGR